MAHTPGPWNFSLTDGAERLLIKSDVNEIVCTVWSDNFIANAHLIATTPDLLEALEAAIPALLAYSNSGLMRCEFEDEDGYSIPLRIARDAIAKAKGQS